MNMINEDIKCLYVMDEDTKEVLVYISQEDIVQKDNLVVVASFEENQKELIEKDGKYFFKGEE